LARALRLSAPGIAGLVMGAVSRRGADLVYSAGFG